MRVNRFKEFFGIEQLGGAELLMATYPLMAPYEYGFIKLSVIIPVLLSTFLMVSPKKKYGCELSSFKYFLIYYVIHFLLWVILLPSIPSYFTNTFITSSIVLTSVIIIIPYIDYKKLDSSINTIAIISFVGLLYHVVELRLGHSITPIRFPFLPDPDITSRVYEEALRPVSFFMEPQTYVSYMIFPLYLALKRHNIVWALLLALSILLSGSTTGIAMIAIIWVAYLTTQKSSVYLKALLVCVFIGLVYFLFNSEYMTVGLDKLNNTNLEEDSRIVNGFIVLANMAPQDLVLGILDANISDYCNHTGVINKVFTSRSDVYVPALWISLIQYGVIGCLLYLNMYWKTLRANKNIIPIWLCVFVCLFTNPSFLGAEFAFIIIFLSSHSYTSITYEENTYNNHAVCK